MTVKEIALVSLMLAGIASSLPNARDTFSTVQSYDGFDIGTLVYWVFEAPDSEGTRKLQFKNSTDVALQITIYYNSHDIRGNLVELYSCTGGSWNGPVWCTGFPFTVGEQNSMMVVVDEDNYEVVKKGTDFSCKYDHYTQPESVETVQATHGKVEFARVLKNYEPGRVILIHGKAAHFEGFPQMIRVVLSDLDPNTYSAVNGHFVLHTTDYANVNLKVFFKGTPEQTEMVVPESPFKLGDNFSLIIFCQTYGYEVIINGIHFVSFEHRIPFKEEMRIVVRDTHVNKIEYY